MARFEQKEDIDTTVEHVWSVISDPKTWGMWFPGISSITVEGPLQKGTQFQWQDGAEGGTGTVIRFDRNQAMEVIIDQGKKSTHHRFALSAKGGVLGVGAHDARLDYVMDTGGGALDQFLRGGNPIDLKKLKDALAKVEDLSERM
jgi:carbon monoxide dehydrogenase subunit G